jgi:hypothetical protein
MPTMMAMLNETIDKLTCMFTNMLPNIKLQNVINGPLSPLSNVCNMNANLFFLIYKYFKPRTGKKYPAIICRYKYSTIKEVLTQF